MVRDFPPAICAAYIATHLANAGVCPGMGPWVRQELAYQALRQVYAGGWRLQRARVLDDMARERDEILDELATVTAQRDRLLAEHVERVAGGGEAPWPYDGLPISPPHEGRGRCGHTIPSIGDAPPLVCVLPAGHPGGHENEDDTWWTVGAESSPRFVGVRRTTHGDSEPVHVGVTHNEIEDLGRQAREVGNHRAGSIDTEPEEWPRV